MDELDSGSWVARLETMPLGERARKLAEVVEALERRLDETEAAAVDRRARPHSPSESPRG